MQRFFYRHDLQLMLLLTPLSVLVQPGAAQAPSDKGRIEGVLVSQTTRKPLGNVTVILRPLQIAASGPSRTGTTNNYLATSDDQGRFVIDQIAPGRYSLAADHPGYVPGSYRTGGTAVFTINPRETIANIHFGLMPYGVIAGRVMDEDDNATTEVQVYTLRHGRLKGRRHLVGGSGPPTSVDDRGSFRIANLVPGSYTLFARALRRGASNVGSEDVSYVTTYHPNALSILDSIPVPVRAGEEVSVAIRLRKARVFRVQGELINQASGTAISDTFALVLRPQQDKQGVATSPIVQTSSVRDGRFTFTNVLPGSYCIESSTMNVIVIGRGALSPKFFGHYPITVTDENRTSLIVPFMPGVIISGTITIEGEQPRSPGIGPPSKLQASIQLVAESPVVRDFSGQSKDDGTFQLEDVAPERYRVAVGGLPEGSYVKSVALNRRDITNGILDLSAGAGGVLDIVISPKGAEVQGAVHNDRGENAADVLVTLVPISESLTSELLLFRHTRTDQNGQFTVKGLPPGEYRVLAWEEVEINLAMDTELRASFETRARSVKFEENARQKVSLELLPRDAIAAAEAKLR